MSGGRPAVVALTLARFRSHALTRLALDPRPVALAGPNGAGKTNLLEALSLLSPGRGLRRAAADDLPRRAPDRDAAAPAGPAPALWRVRATLATADAPVEVALEGGPDHRRRVEIDGKPAPQTALAELAPMLWLTPAMDRLWIEGAEGRRRFLDRATLSFFPAHGRAAAAYERALRERGRLLREARPDSGWLAALEAGMAEAGAELMRARAAAAARISAAQDARSLFPHAEIAILHGMERLAADMPPDPAAVERDALAEALRAAFAASRREDAAAGRALVGPHRADLTAVYAAKGVEARLCSTGEQKALLVSLVLANARALAAEGRPAPILLLDEVAAHLDADRRAALYDEICALGAQAWMTGTDPALFAALGPRAQTFAVADSPAGSVVRPGP